MDCKKSLKIVKSKSIMEFYINIWVKFPILQVLIMYNCFNYHARRMNNLDMCMEINTSTVDLNIQTVDLNIQTLLFF